MEGHMSQKFEHTPGPLSAPDLLAALEAIANGTVDPAIWPDLAVRYEKFAAAAIAEVKGDT
jgi:hypothetical protein